MSNHWEKQFGKARRASDKKLLQECERQIAAEEKALHSGPLLSGDMIASAIDEGKERIAKAFGRLPL